MDTPTAWQRVRESNPSFRTENPAAYPIAELAMALPVRIGRYRILGLTLRTNSAWPTFEMALNEWNLFSPRFTFILFAGLAAATAFRRSRLGAARDADRRTAARALVRAALPVGALDALASLLASRTWTSTHASSRSSSRRRS